MNEARDYSAEEAAVICGVQTSSICRWFDAGRIEGYRERRNGIQRRFIPEKNLLAFMEREGIEPATQTESDSTYIPLAIVYGTLLIDAFL